MTLQTAMLATLIVILGAAQYALCVQAIRDLVRRPRVRGENKALWALGILCIPIGGAILYNWMGPTSFIHRPTAVGSPTRDRGYEAVDTATAAINVTPIADARAARRRRVASTVHHDPLPTARRTTPHRTTSDRTGS